MEGQRILITTLIITVLIVVMIGLVITYGVYGNIAKSIVVNHYKIFKRRHIWQAMVSTSICPFLLSIVVCSIKPLDSIIAGHLLTIFSIFTTMLFTLLVLMIDIKQKNYYKIENNDVRIDGRISRVQELINETYYSIMFEILVVICVLLSGFSILFVISEGAVMPIYNLQIALTFIVCFFVFTFVFTLFVVLKRVYEIIKYDMEH